MIPPFVKGDEGGSETMYVFITRMIPEVGLVLLKKEAEVNVWPGPEDEAPSKKEKTCSIFF